MAAIKSYSDLQQSKKLAKILPFESADMYWKNGVSDKYIQCFTPFVIDEYRTNVDFDYDIPCWSLAALLDVLKDYTLQKTGKNVFVIYENEKTVIGTEDYDNPVDACVAMIEKFVVIMDKQFEYKGHVCKIYHFTRNQEITGYGAALYKDGERLAVTNHGWNLIQNGSIDSVTEDCKKYIDKLL